MTRSRLRKLQRIRQHEARRMLKAVPLASAILAAMPAAHAQEQAQAQEEANALQEVIVSAQKRTENLQNVPISVTAINTQALDDLHINNFDDYVKFLPSVTAQGGGAGGGAAAPGFSHVIIRGVSSDSTFNHSGPLPTVGTYLDEQPITTIQGALDVHIYDIARVEVLSGPQGTLYGASSEAGTIRVITNKPDLSGFKAEYQAELNTIMHGEPGGVLQGFVNIPLSDTAAVRLVGWATHTGGYIDNVAATRTFPQFGITIDNHALAKDNFNDVTTYGARAALRVDLNENWTITPQVMGQETKAGGFSAYNPLIGDLALTHFSPDNSEDHWIDAALTVQGKISNFDLTYAGAYLKRNDITHTDYSDYSLAYDISIPSYTAPIVDNSGNNINPTQQIWGKDRYSKQSHEIRVASPADWRLRFVAGLFYQRQEHGIEQRYVIDNLAQSLWVTGWSDTWWLTEQVRVDRDYAIFGQANFDILPNRLILTVGERFYWYDNSLEGFRGFGANNPLGAGSGLGEQSTSPPCDYSVAFHGAPCLSFSRDTQDHGNTPLVTLSYKFDDSRMVYATYSKGFRPGGINRVGDHPDYQADFLKNYEIGWKTSWLDNRLRFNGAIFREDWDNFQFSFLGPNSVTIVANAGAARVKGIESQLAWAVTPGLTLSAAMSVLNPEITKNYCGALDPVTLAPITGNPCVIPSSTPGEPPTVRDPLAPTGTQLPGTSKFKGNVVARYAFGLAGMDAHAQAAFVYQSAQWADLRIAQREAIGQLPAFGSLDLAFGLSKDTLGGELFVNNVFDRRGQTYRFTQCGSCSIVANYVVPIQPMTVGVRFQQKF
jgi:outer membrane receptor protein involved in Fe transport